jgi:hypothetical protein
MHVTANAASVIQMAAINAIAVVAAVVVVNVAKAKKQLPNLQPQ